MASETSVPNFWDPAVMLQQLSPQEQALRDLFVKEYLKDHDALKAAIRCGFVKSVAMQYADELVMCPYVQRKLQAAQAEVQADPVAYQNQLKAGLQREANNPYSPAAARVAALVALTKIEGMGVEKKETEDKEVALIEALKGFAQRAPV